MTKEQIAEAIDSLAKKVYVQKKSIEHLLSDIKKSQTELRNSAIFKKLHRN
jgi:3-methyladenine DNA glycosylase AlkC